MYTHNKCVIKLASNFPLPGAASLPTEPSVHHNLQGVPQNKPLSGFIIKTY